MSMAAGNNPHFEIAGRPIGPGHPAYVIAEISANHNQDIDRAIELIGLAADAGADAVKLQTYTPDTLTIACDNEHFRIAPPSLWAGRTLHDLYGEAYTPWEWHERLFAAARARGIHCFSTPFDDSAVELLEGLDAPVYKVASFEVVDLGLLRRIAATGKPVIMSTGMASLAEIEEAVRTLRANGASSISLLKCTSAYPAPPESMNLATIPHLGRSFGVIAGLSDHTMGSAVAVAAVALGANVIEKHFTKARADGGPDSAFSMEPDEFARMVQDIRMVEKAIGTVSYTRTPDDERSAKFRRSLFVVKDMKAGEAFTSETVRSIRPGNGLLPRYMPHVIGRHAGRDIPRGTPLSWDLIGG